MKHRLNTWPKGQLLFLLIGAASLIWFLVRVIPKPARAAYPCQRAAFPLASSFVIWLTGVFASAAVLRKSRLYWSDSRHAVAVFLMLTGLLCAFWFGVYVPSSETEAAGSGFVPADPPNTPIGTARGLFHGRVVWKHDPEATSWDGLTNYWWSDENTDQDRVRAMLSESLQWLTEAETDAQAWDLIFQHHNQSHGRGDVGYTAGEKIAIKLNLNQVSSTGERNNDSFTTPQLVLALLEQLVNEAGVAPGDITFYDALRVVPDVIAGRCRAAYPEVNFMDYSGLSGRLQATPDPGNAIPFSKDFDIVEPGSGGTAYVPTVLSDASYHVNIGGLKGHQLAGVTLCAKNLFGSFLAESETTPMSASPKAAGLHPYVAVHQLGGGAGAGGPWDFDARPMGSYTVLVDLMGHRDLGGKTILYLIDGLYATRHQSEPISLDSRWSSPPFLGDWPSSLFLSQDPVAIDSVALDFCRNEPGMDLVYGDVDNYLHEAALASNPPSGTLYDPERDSSPLEDLGVHEHWNNGQDKAYSGNFGQDFGVELVSMDPRIERTITVAASPPEAGMVEGSGVFQNGHLMRIEAVAKEGYRFSAWSGASGVSNSLAASTRVLADANKTLLAEFILDSTVGYNDYLPVFEGETDIDLIGPEGDFDADGISNFMEYAFLGNPVSPAASQLIQNSIHTHEHQRHGRASFKVRDNDPELLYFVELSDDLLEWTSCGIHFNEPVWECSRPDKLSISSMVTHGDGSWTLEVEDQTAVSPGNRRFIRLQAKPGYSTAAAPAFSFDTH